jgi:ribokinase
MGVRAQVIGRIGTDANGEFVLTQAAKCGIDTSAVVRDDRYPTVASYVLIEKNGERHTLSSVDLHAELSSADIPDALLMDSDLVFMGSALMMRRMDEGGIVDMFSRARKFGVKTAMDVSVRDYNEDPRKLYDLLREALRFTDIFIPSLGEMQWLTGLTAPEEIMAELAQFGITVFGLKLGPEGCIVREGNDSFKASAFKEFKPVDTTGAGDSFMGGFLSARLRGMDSPTSALFGNLIASFNVTKIGAVGGVPELAEAEEHWKKIAPQTMIVKLE